MRHADLVPGAARNQKLHLETSDISPGMPTATKTSLEDRMTETGSVDRILPEWEEKIEAINIPACFSRMPQESRKDFPHTKQVGTYLVGRMINKGSFAKVMEGLHIPTGEKVAIKVIDKRKAKQDSYVLKNMKRESRIHQMIKHPNVVQLYETLETDNSYYMVMELCLGGDLLDRICDKQRLAEREMMTNLYQVLIFQSGYVNKYQSYLVSHNILKQLPITQDRLAVEQAATGESQLTSCKEKIIQWVTSSDMPHWLLHYWNRS
ncbi:hypothetical protein CIB84_003781 [Bambusicola thoracicus]|uniref:non-specific serine/threonine protein kinase n=1 Tax=Bambusicola thoracicus TaxID=9083 RepID=A0A2P4T803_BAMTH|nr:hypothetical protein CIB84_003781 [Bambusicola thoracicus]